MSRYSLKPLPRRSDLYEVAVGWDPALETYFVVAALALLSTDWSQRSGIGVAAGLAKFQTLRIFVRRSKITRH